MTTKYALSYHVMKKIDDLMDSIVFSSEHAANKFVWRLNRILDTRGYVSVSVLCDRAEIDISDEDRDIYDRVVWKKPVSENMVIPTLREGGRMYSIIFPPLTEIDPVAGKEEGG